MGSLGRAEIPSRAASAPICTTPSSSLSSRRLVGSFGYGHRAAGLDTACGEGSHGEREKDVFEKLSREFREAPILERKLAAEASLLAYVRNLATAR